MAQSKETPKRPADSLEESQLKDLAREATKHLDDVLSGGEPDGSAEREEKTVPGAAPGPAADAPRGETPSPARPARPQPSASSPDSRPKALVAHVIPGMARALANLLLHSGFKVTVIDSPYGIDSEVEGDRWDIAFVQGTAMPYPGKRIALAALSRCEDRGTPVVLLARRGDPLVAEAAGSSAVGLLEWPFRSEKLLQLLSEVFPRRSWAASRSAARRA